MVDGRSVPAALVVMGVSGSGKSTVAAAVASRASAMFLDADDFHPASNTAKMAAGIPLTDDDRMPWLASVGDEVGRRLASGTDVVLACSALKRSYRDVLRDRAGAVSFALLQGSPELLAARVAGRTDHFMPASLLASQLATLEPLATDEAGFAVDIDRPPAEIADVVVAGWRSLTS